jgi:hypothetical protein
MALNIVEPLTVVNGCLACAGVLSDKGKELILEQMHSKFLGHQIMELLSVSACQAIKQSNATTYFNSIELLYQISRFFTCPV